MGVMLDDRKFNGMMFNERSFHNDNPLVVGEGYLTREDYDYFKESYDDVWEKHLDENIEVVFDRFRDTDEYKRATKGMSAQRRNQFDKELKNKVKSKIIQKRERVERILATFSFAGLIILIAGMFVSCCAPYAGIAIMVGGWTLTMLAFVVECVRYIVGGAEVSKDEIKEILDEVI